MTAHGITLGEAAGLQQRQTLERSARAAAVRALAHWWDSVVTTRQAAELVGVTEDRIRQWAARGHLSRVGHVDGVAYYSAADVVHTEKAMRTPADRGRVARALLDGTGVTGSTYGDPQCDSR